MANAFSVAREAAISEHKKHVGKNESPGGSNKTKFGKWFGLNPAPYCAMAIVATNAWAGSSAGTVRSASSSAIQRWGVATGRKVTTPQRGDLIHVYKNGRSVHIERVLSYSGGKLICIGSNTSNTSGGSTADGGGTYINDRTSWWRNRNSNSGWSIKGITRPFYGVTTEDVRTVQTAARIKVDGKIGPATVEAVRVLQRQHGLTVDGFPGPATLAAITSKPTAKPAAKPSRPALAVDGKLGSATAKRIQSWLGVTADGVIGPATIRAWQTAHKTPVDGKITGQGTAARPACPAIRRDCLIEGNGGSKLIRSVQAAVGLTGKAVDGKLGPDTVKALQRHYNRQE